MNTAKQPKALADHIADASKMVAPSNLKQLADSFPELNMANYWEDDVEALHNWSLEVVQAITTIGQEAEPVVLPEPVAAQVRFKPENDTTWSRWKVCAVEDAREIEAYTLVNGWDYEVRYLHTEQQVRALLATGGQAQADKEMQLAMQEASSLAQSIFALHYREDEDYASGRVVWGLCDSLRGVISQIDNMTTGLVRAPQPQADALDAECFRFWVSEAARSPAAMAKLIMHCTTEDEYRAAITQCIDARKAAIAAAKENK